MADAAAIQSTQAVLAAMTNKVMARKDAKLTLKNNEAPTFIPPKLMTEATFPNDMPIEAIEAAVRNVRREIGYILAALDAIDEHIGKAADAAPIEDQTKAKERAADESFAESFAKKQAEAKEAVFTQPIVVEDDELEDGWTCPEHDKVYMKSSKSNRKYRACPECSEFEVLA